MISTSGGLPAGTYAVCYTNHKGNEMSGNGPIATITLSDVGGIQLLNRPENAIAWVTDANESIFSRVGAINNITELPYAEPLTSFLCSPPHF